MMWDFFPPVLWWIGIGCVLFLVMAFMQQFQGSRFPLVSRPVEAIILTIAAIIVSMFPFGPLMAAGIAACAIISMGIIWKRRLKKTMPKSDGTEPLRTNGPLAVVHAVAAVALITTAIYSFAQRARMDTADKILAFPGTTWGARWERRLEREEPQSFDQYRKLITRGDSFSAGNAAQRLLKGSNSSSDIELVVKAVERFRTRSGGWGQDYLLQEALKNKTGLSLQDATGETWRKAMNEADRLTTGITAGT